MDWLKIAESICHAPYKALQRPVERVLPVQEGSGREK